MEAQPNHYTKSDIIADLNSLMLPRGATVIVHSSMKSIGEVNGGAETVLNSLIDIIKELDGTLIIPTHTWTNIGKDCVTLDLMKPETNLGIIPTLALNHREGVRTENPTHSAVLFGDPTHILELISGEGCVFTPTSPNGLYGKLNNDNCFVLLIGVGQEKNTFLHAVDEILETKDRMDTTPTPVSIRYLNGRIEKRELYMFNEDKYGDTSVRFPKYEPAFRYHGYIKDAMIGNAPTQLCYAPGMFEVVRIIYERAAGDDPLSDNTPLDEELYI